MVLGKITKVGDSQAASTHRMPTQYCCILGTTNGRSASILHRWLSTSHGALIAFGLACYKPRDMNGACYMPRDINGDTLLLLCVYPICCSSLPDGQAEEVQEDSLTTGRYDLRGSPSGKLWSLRSVMLVYFHKSCSKGFKEPVKSLEFMRRGVLI